MQSRGGVTIVSDDELKDSSLNFSKDDVLYVPDESSLPIVCKKITDEKLVTQLENLKDKYVFRTLLKDLYPDFYFKAVHIDELKNVVLPDQKKYMTKARKGFFGFGIKEIDYRSDLKKITDELKREVKHGARFFSSDVFTADQFVIEEYIEGEEYTFDAYYDSKGEPVVVSFCHHPMTLVNRQTCFHLLYYTNHAIYKRYSAQVVDILRYLNKKLDARNLPLHAEFREREGKLVPIEVNVPRYGGFGLADLPYYAYGVNPYQYFFENKRPDWEEIFKSTEDTNFGWVLCCNAVHLDIEHSKPNYEKMKADLGTVLHFHELDYRQNPAFGIAYVENKSERDLQRLLSIDFNDYFSPIEKK